MNYLDKLLPPVRAWDSSERDIRDRVAHRRASADERAWIATELERMNWPEEMARKLAGD